MFLVACGGLTGQQQAHQNHCSHNEGRGPQGLTHSKPGFAPGIHRRQHGADEAAIGFIGCINHFRHNWQRANHAPAGGGGRGFARHRARAQTAVFPARRGLFPGQSTRAAAPRPAGVPRFGRTLRVPVSIQDTQAPLAAAYRASRLASGAAAGTSHPEEST